MVWPVTVHQLAQVSSKVGMKPSNQRGYGYRHQVIRKRLAPNVNAGLVDCWRCGQRIEEGEPWDLGHDDIDRTKYRGPEHVRCNRSVAGRKPTLDVSRAW